MFYERRHKVQQGLPSECTKKYPHFWRWSESLKLLMRNEIIKDNMSKLSFLKGAESFMSTIQFFEA